MRFIEEKEIEAVLLQWEKPDTYERALASFMDSFPQVTGFLLQESTEILTEGEKDVMWFIATTLFETIQVEVDTTVITDKNLMSAEEKNWTIYQETPNATFYDRISIFFENYPQEDLLAFIEDMTQIDEDEDMTKIGREVIFITCKSLLDVMTAS